MKSLARSIAFLAITTSVGCGGADGSTGPTAREIQAESLGVRGTRLGPGECYPSDLATRLLATGQWELGPKACGAGDISIQPKQA